MALPVEQRAAKAAAYDLRESISWVPDNVLTANPLTPADREQVIVDSLRGAPQAKAAWPKVAMLEDIGGEVSSIDVPVLVIAGDADRVDRLETLQKELQPRIAGARLHVLPWIGHLSPLEAPGAIAAAIEQFVGEIETLGQATTVDTTQELSAAFNAKAKAKATPTPTPTPVIPTVSRNATPSPKTSRVSA